MVSQPHNLAGYYEPELKALMHALMFDAKDLASNQNGRLTDAQHDRFVAMRRWMVPAEEFEGLAILGALLSLAAVGALFWRWTASARAAHRLQHSSAVWLLAGVVSCAFLVGRWCIKRIWPTAQEPDDLTRLRVRCVEGAVQCIVRSSYSHSRVTEAFYVKMSGIKFRVTPEAARAFADGRRYRVYFVVAPVWCRIASAEPIAP